MSHALPLTFAPLALALVLAACSPDSAPLEAATRSDAAQPAAAAPVAAQPVEPVESAPDRPAVDADAHVGMDAPAAAATDDVELRPQFSACMRAAGGATPAMQDCIAAEYTHQDRRLNAAYGKARAGLPAAQANPLRDAQRDWIKRRDATCRWDAATQGQAQRLVANDCALRLTAQRADELERMIAGKPAASAEASVEARADAAADAEGRLRLALSGAVVSVDADGCSQEATSLQRCTGGARVSVDAGGTSRRLQVSTLYLNSAATAYRGPLDDVADRTGRTLVLADFDRDGREDIALWTGKRGANGAASYEVYLADGTGYRRNAALSALTDGANGLFTIENGQLVRSSKSGCCLHTTQRYAVRDGAPVLIEEVVEDATGNRAAPRITTRRLIEGRMQTVDP